MPEPATARRPTNARRASKRVAGSPDTSPTPKPFHDPASIQDRIKQWQAQGAAHAQDPDALSSRSAPRSDVCGTPDRSQAGTPDERHARTTPRKSSTRWVHKNERQWVKERRARMSDQQRKASRDEQDENARDGSAEPPYSPTPLSRVDEDLRASNISHSRAEREERRRRRREARALLAGGTSYDDGIRVRPMSASHPPSEKPDETENVSNVPMEADDHSHSRQEEHDAFNEDDSGYNNAFRDADEDGQTYQPSKYAQTLGRAPELANNDDKTRTKKRDIFSKTKEILIGKPDQPPALSNRLPTIEAWLEEQTDPFIEPELPETIDPLPVQKPLKLPSRRKKVSVDASVLEDPNKIWDSVTPPQPQDEQATKQHRRASRKNSKTPKTERRKFSFEVYDPESKGGESPPPPEYSEHQNASPVTLQRRGARGGKAKPRTLSAALDAAKPLTELSQAASVATPPEQTPTKADKVSKPLPQPPSAETDENTSNGHAQNLNSSHGLKRKLTTHEDLISVLSQPRTRRSTKSVKSVARHHSVPKYSSVDELLSSMRQDEEKYHRELRTLVDGVTPVLLQSFLSKTDSSAAAGLFSDGATEDSHLTRSVIDMAVAVERLKSLHNRIPLQNVDSLLAWAQTAHKPYSDYVKAWRLGFQDVIVNLAPLDNMRMAEEDSMSRDIDGDVVDADGQKVDVAYLQKRPLVRLKRLSKLFCDLQDALPTSKSAANMANIYADLTDLARRRHRAEQGRLEDEAAAKIDATRVRDIRSLAPQTSVKVDAKRRVRARDCFNMTLYHSTGQRMDCRIEIVLRDNQNDSATGGDVLICQIEDEGEWLLFAPVELSKISARRGESGCDLVIMIRGAAGLTQEWSELLALQTDNADAAVEWMHMLGSNPLPPKLSRVPSYMNHSKETAVATPLEPAAEALVSASLSASALANLPSDVDVPIGEPSVLGHRRRRPSRPASSQQSSQGSADKSTQKLNLGGGLRRKQLPDRYQAQAAADNTRYPAHSLHSSDRSTISGTTCSTLHPVSQNNSSAPTPVLAKQDVVPEDVNPNRYSPQKMHAQLHISDEAERQYGKSRNDDSNLHARRSDPGEVPLASGALQDPSDERELHPSVRPPRPPLHQRLSSTPADRSPQNVRTRPHNRTQSTNTPLTDTIRDQWAAISGIGRRLRSQPSSPEKPAASKRRSSPPEVFTEDLPPPASQTRGTPETPTDLNAFPPSAFSPRNITSPSDQRHDSDLPKSAPQTPRHEIRPSSSPLKHEYEPSSRSASSSSSSDDDSDNTSDTSDDVGSENKDQAMPLLPIGVNKRRFSTTGQKSPMGIPSVGTQTLQPSDSASQGPYRRAPPPSAYPAESKKRTIATVCSWSDRGVWEPIQDDECSIVVSPGLIQAFPITEAHSRPMDGAEWQQEMPKNDVPQEQPFVEFELTPIVPLRKGTALDITIRSPPTSNSKIQTTSNVMFRSRSVQECERLYNMINWARCNNPTYAALARSRAREQPTVTFATNVGATKSRSWFSFGSHNKSRYRATSAPPSTMGESTASASTTTSAFSALKRFGVNSPFSLHRSSVIHRPGLGTGGSLYSSSSGTGPGSGSSTPAPSQAGFIPGKNGPNVPATSAEAAAGGGMVNNMKIRLFIRAGQKWEALGACSLTVLPAVTDNATTPNAGIDRQSSYAGSAYLGSPTSRPPSIATQSGPGIRQPRLPSSSLTPHRLHLDGREKRILITKHKNSSAVILDEILGESCFEKVMQTGIAVKVWKEDAGVAEWGGVLTGRGKVYMMQFPTSAEAGWVFGMCGTFRYGEATGGAGLA